ncbi:class I SAM-dependent methyltransferase [Dongia sp.]|uniref:class I SAM-dependent methyltransferase n=1 Tax=Dongia sp. TaxID=1977262 RepID=UPI0035B42100
MAEVDFISLVHKSTKRDYLARVNEIDKAIVAEKAIQYGPDYWDGDRLTGYGGYRYDGRWRKVADAMVARYGIKPGDRILDVGAGKGFLLHDFTEAMPGVEVTGIDISDYAIREAKPEVRTRLQVGNASKLPFPDDSFDFVVSINTLHNLYLPDLFGAVKEIDRVCRTGKSHITVEAYRNEREKVNLMYWQLTCRAFHTPEEWQWLFSQCGYRGDWGFIFFE